MALNPTEVMLAAASLEGIYKLWDLHQGKGIFFVLSYTLTLILPSKVVRTIQGPSPQGCVQGLEFHPFGDYLASATGTQLKLWDTRRKECIKVKILIQIATNTDNTIDIQWTCCFSQRM